MWADIYFFSAVRNANATKDRADAACNLLPPQEYESKNDTKTLSFTLLEKEVNGDKKEAEIGPPLLVIYRPLKRPNIKCNKRILLLYCVRGRG